MDNSRMQAGDIISSLRKKRDELDMLAKGLEQNLGIASASTFQQKSINVETIKGYMGEKAFRSVVLAKVFSVSVQEIEKLMNAENGFKLGLRGWYYVPTQQGKKVHKLVETPRVHAPVVPIEALAIANV